MDVTPLVRKGQQIIQSYSAGSFKINGQVYDHAVIVSPEQTIEWQLGGVDDFHSLDEKHFSVLIDNAGEIDVLLLGTGCKIEFLSPELRISLKNQGLLVEMMDTGAACRTYNVLMAEGRRVVCALLPA